MDKVSGSVVRERNTRSCASVHALTPLWGIAVKIDAPVFSIQYMSIRRIDM